MFYHAKISTLIYSMSFSVRIKCAKEAKFYEFEHSIFHLCSCLREKTRTLLHIIKQCARLVQLEKLTVMFYYICTK